MAPNLRGNNVSGAAATTGQALAWDGTQWAPANAASPANLATMVFQPGGTASYNVFTAWADLYAAFVATNGPVDIAIDDTFAVPSPDLGAWDFQYRATFVPHNTNISPQTYLLINDGSTLLNVASVSGQILVECQGTTTPCLGFTGNPTFNASAGCILRNLGTQPVFRLSQAGQLVSVGFYQGAQFQSTGGGPLADISLAGVGLIVFAGFFPQFSTGNVVTGVAGSSFTFLYDSSLQGYPINPGFAWATTAFPFSASNYTSYNDAAVSPPLGSDNVQGAIDALKGVTGANLATMVFQPNGTPSSNVFTTWGDLYAAFSATRGVVAISVDSSLATASVDVGVWDMQGRAVFRSAGQSSASPSVLTLPDGAVLRNPAMFDASLNVSLLATTTPNLDLTDGQALLVRDGAIVQNFAGTQPAMRVVNGFVGIIFNDTSLYDNAAGPNCLVDLSTATAAASVLMLDYSGPNGNNVVSGVAGSTLFYTYTASTFLVPTNPTFFGGTNITVADNSAYVAYNDALVSPQLGSSNVQGAIDALKSNPPTTPNTIIWQTHPVQNITAAADAFLPQGSYVRFTSAGNHTLTSTPTIQWAGAVAGQVVILHNVGAPGTGHVTLNAGVATALSLSTSNKRIDEGGTMMLVYDGSVWAEVSHTQATST